MAFRLDAEAVQERICHDVDILSFLATKQKPNATRMDVRANLHCYLNCEDCQLQSLAICLCTSLYIARQCNVAYNILSSLAWHRMSPLHSRTEVYHK